MLLGPAACLLLVGFVGGVSWLWLFGDNAWPGETQWVLPVIGSMGGALVALACIIIAYRYGKKREALPQAGSRTAWRKVLALAVTPLALILLFGIKAWLESREYADGMRIATEREAAFAVLSGTRHRIVALELDHSADGRFRATVRMMGEREGNYLLRWQVADTGFGAALASGVKSCDCSLAKAKPSLPSHWINLRAATGTSTAGGRWCSRRRAVPPASIPLARVRRGLIQLAWRFLQFQKQSTLVKWFRLRTEGPSGARKTTMIVVGAQAADCALADGHDRRSAGRRGVAAGPLRRDLKARDYGSIPVRPPRQ